MYGVRRADKMATTPATTHTQGLDREKEVNGKFSKIFTEVGIVLCARLWSCCRRRPRRSCGCGTGECYRSSLAVWLQFHADGDDWNEWASEKRNEKLHSFIRCCVPRWSYAVFLVRCLSECELNEDTKLIFTYTHHWQHTFGWNVNIL